MKSPSYTRALTDRRAVAPPATSRPLLLRTLDMLAGVFRRPAVELRAGKKSGNAPLLKDIAPPGSAGSRPRR